MISLTPVLLTPGKCCRPKTKHILGGRDDSHKMGPMCQSKDAWWRAETLGISSKKGWAVSIPKVNTGTPQQDMSWACDTGKYFMANWWSSHSSLMPYERSLLSFPRCRNLQPLNKLRDTRTHRPPLLQLLLVRRGTTWVVRHLCIPNPLNRGFRWWQFMSSFPRRR